MAWTLDQISWQNFRSDLVDHDILEVVKTASLIEANSSYYVIYLRNVFSEDEQFQRAISDWGDEEYQHGLALGRWAEMADPNFDFNKSLEYFRNGYQIPFDSDVSVRGSQVGELMSRCVVEAGTSSFYSAIRDYVEEPCLKQICNYIAQDEINHYNLFRKTIKRTYETDYDNMSRWQRIKITMGRVKEADDDEISFAYYSAIFALSEKPPRSYDLKECNKAYFANIYQIYQKQHIKILVGLISRTIGLNPNGILPKISGAVLWGIWRSRSRLRKITDGIS